ncbi:MAG: DEAD/DEAH box helicase [Bacteroidetes bacterium]|nr:MAG: DEAD/DEAH box helicase [Bacteroidota bacterium]
MPLLNALDDMGFDTPTDIQEKAFPIIMSGRDVVGIAQTGTGKTLAYLLPLLRQLPFSEQRQPRILILVPTRELVMQVVEEARRLTAYMSVRVDGVYGGTNINTQSNRVYQGVDLLVATPGRLFDLAMRGTLRLKSIQKLVIDEVDEMLNLGFRTQLNNILDLLPEKRQNLMFSATLADDVEIIIKDFFREPEWIDVHFRGTPISRIRQKIYKVPNFATRFNLLSLLLEDDDVFDKVIVFTPSRKVADKIFNKLTPRYGGQMSVIHSNKSQNQRFNALDELKSGDIRILISTDLVARGVDIFEVSHVFNFGLPEIPGAYIHRIGRTGRVDKDGEAISIITEAEEGFRIAIEEFIGRSIPEEQLPEGLVISNAEDWDEELAPSAGDKAYLRPVKIYQGGGAFHQKKEKNLKVNLGGPGRKKRLALKKTGGKKKR